MCIRRRHSRLRVNTAPLPNYYNMSIGTFKYYASDVDDVGRKNYGDGRGEIIVILLYYMNMSGAVVVLS